MARGLALTPKQMHLQPCSLILLGPEPLPAWPLQVFLILLLFCTGEASFHFEMASVQGNKHASLSLVPPLQPLGLLLIVSRVLQFPVW